MARRLIAPEDLPSYGVTIGDRQRKRLEAARMFPRRVQLTARSHAYVEAEIDAYAAERIAARDGVMAA